MRHPKAITASLTAALALVALSPRAIAESEPDVTKPGTYRAGKWVYALRVEKTNFGERRSGELRFDGKPVATPEKVGDYYPTPWGRMYWRGSDERLVRGWMPTSKRIGRRLTPWGAPVEQVDWTRSGAYAQGKWTLKYVVEIVGKKAKRPNRFTGFVSYDGRQLTGRKGGDLLHTPWGLLQWFGRAKGGAFRRQWGRPGKVKPDAIPLPHPSEAIRRIEAFDKAAGRFALQMRYFGPADTSLPSFAAAVGDRTFRGADVKLTVDQARAMIESLADEPYFGPFSRGANVAFKELAPPKGPTMVLLLLGPKRLELRDDLGWGPHLLPRIEQVRRALPATSRKALEPLESRGRAVFLKPTTKPSPS